MSVISINKNLFFVTVYFTVDGDHLRVAQYSDPQSRDAQSTVPRAAELSLKDMEGHLKNGPVQLDLRDASALPEPLVAYPRQLGCETAAYIPTSKMDICAVSFNLPHRARIKALNKRSSIMCSTVQLTKMLSKTQPPLRAWGSQAKEMDAWNRLPQAAMSMT